LTRRAFERKISKKEKKEREESQNKNFSLLLFLCRKAGRDQKIAAMRLALPSFAMTWFRKSEKERGQKRERGRERKDEREIRERERESEKE